MTCTCAVVHPVKKIWEGISVGAVMVPVTWVRGSLASMASAWAAASLPLPRCCFQGSSKSAGPCLLAENSSVSNYDVRMQYPMVTYLVTEAELGKQPVCAIAQETAGCFSCAGCYWLSVWSCLPPESKRVPDSKSRKKVLLFPQA